MPLISPLMPVPLLLQWPLLQVAVKMDRERVMIIRSTATGVLYE